MLCSRVVKRGNEAVKASPEGSLYTHPRYTETVELPSVKVLAEGADWRAEALEDGGEEMFYIQYKKIFSELDACFSSARGCKLLLYGDRKSTRLNSSHAD